MTSKQSKDAPARMGRRDLLQIIPLASGLVASAGVVSRARAADPAQSTKQIDAIVSVDKKVALGPYEPMSSMAVARRPRYRYR